MNKQDLKEGQEVYVKGRVIHTGDHLDIVLDKGSFIDNAIILHHEKPVVPQFVADYIEERKKSCLSLMGVMYYARGTEIERWLIPSDNQEIFALAWINGYEVEKEPKYTVKCKATKQYLSNDEIGIHFDPSFRSNFTKSDLEKLGLGWVFDCEGMEVEKVGK